MRRGRYAKVSERNKGLLGRIRAIKADHPFWGYRRVWAHLRYVDGLEVNLKRVYRLMSEHDLLVKPNLKIKARRKPDRSKPRPTRPNEWWGIDMTKVMSMASAGSMWSQFLIGAPRRWSAIMLVSRPGPGTG